MICVFCKSETDVMNSRPKAQSPSVWRRRQCQNCGKAFTTLELPDYAKSLSVLAQNAKKTQPFNRDKLFLSLNKSLGHRTDALEASTALTMTIISKILKSRRESGIIPVTEIATTALQTLKRYDPLAAASYKAYHQTTLKALNRKN